MGVVYGAAVFLTTAGFLLLVIRGSRCNLKRRRILSVVIVIGTGSVALVATAAVITRIISRRGKGSATAAITVIRPTVTALFRRRGQH